jgi:aerobic carbon-monoxide dehydrogenase medium subunit
MKPPPFEHHAPETLSEVLELLDRASEDAKVLAGGQSLMPLLNLRLARPVHLAHCAGVRWIWAWVSHRE